MFSFSSFFSISMFMFLGACESFIEFFLWVTILYLQAVCHGYWHAWWRRSQSVRLAVSRPLVHFPFRFISKDLNKWYSQLGAQQERNSVTNKPASSLVVFFGNTLNEIPPSLRSRQVVQPNSYLPILLKDWGTERRLIYEMR